MMMSVTIQPDRPRFVLDASIATKWFLRDEDYVTEAVALLRRMQFGRAEYLAPSQIQFEVANALCNAVRRARMDQNLAQRALSRWVALRIPVVTSDHLMRDAMRLSLAFGCAFYDGLYLALAEATDLPLIHADERLHNTLAGRFPNELWIADVAKSL
jgi:predicted nucleic acid-binding protein